MELKRSRKGNVMGISPDIIYHIYIDLLYIVLFVGFFNYSLVVLDFSTLARYSYLTVFISRAKHIRVTLDYTLFSWK